MTSKNLLQRIKKREENVLAKHNPTGFSTPLEEVMSRTGNALDLGRGDLRRYGCVLDSTTQEIEASILMVAYGGYFVEALDLNKEYAALERKQKSN